MIGIVETDGDDLANARYRRTEASAGGNQWEA
jgi:hypothetical protein